MYIEYYCQPGKLTGDMVFRVIVGLHGGMFGDIVDLGFQVN